MKIRNIDLGRYPIFLAPMEDVTDPAFRLMCKKFGADMVYTEFVSADALIRSVGKTMQKPGFIKNVPPNTVSPGRGR